MGTTELATLLTWTAVLAGMTASNASVSAGSEIFIANFCTWCMISNTTRTREAFVTMTDAELMSTLQLAPAVFLAFKVVCGLPALHFDFMSASL